MNVLFVSIDSLRRDFFTTYRDRPFGYDYAVETPNLDRFAERATVFDTHYAGSLFCMPARREWLTGTREFPWRGWGPIEPFDDTLPRIARSNGTVAGLVTDHYHYFQHGASGYYDDFNGFEFVRGHEHDAWRTAPPNIDESFASQIHASDPEELSYMHRAQYARNVADFDPETESDFFAPKVFSRTARWIEDNQSWDDWFCFVDSFDVHEPFHCPEPYASRYTEDDPRDPEMPVWPHWGRTDAGQAAIDDRQLAFVKAQFAGKVTMVDEWFGRLCDTLDSLDAWSDTVVVVTADHGFSLGDHGWLGKADGPLYDTLAHTPLLVWHPTYSDTVERVGALTSAVDLHPTLASVMDAKTDGPHGRSLLSLLDGESNSIRDAAVYGIWGSDVNVTDGQFTYHRQCDEGKSAVVRSTFQMNPRAVFQPPDPPMDPVPDTLPYTDRPVWRYEAPSVSRQPDTMLFDTDADPAQKRDLLSTGSEHAERMRELLVSRMQDLSAPTPEFGRFGLSTPPGPD
ncbi:sulfatase [Salinarchaeum laminariae]|uniref:sulfatase n=1 Tax=Salinarchaeum laminariae TaxID=869888 RepID=UPI0020BF685E|nr:sulfatase [Salinarchaeum laminariae]